PHPRTTALGLPRRSITESDRAGDVVRRGAAPAGDADTAPRSLQFKMSIMLIHSESRCLVVVVVLTSFLSCGRRALALARAGLRLALGGRAEGLFDPDELGEDLVADLLPFPGAQLGQVLSAIEKSLEVLGPGPPQLLNRDAVIPRRAAGLFPQQLLDSGDDLATADVLALEGLHEDGQRRFAEPAKPLQLVHIAREE